MRLPETGEKVFANGTIAEYVKPKGLFGGHVVKINGEELIVDFIECGLSEEHLQYLQNMHDTIRKSF